MDVSDSQRSRSKPTPPVAATAVIGPFPDGQPQNIHSSYHPRCGCALSLDQIVETKTRSTTKKKQYLDSVLSGHTSYSSLSSLYFISGDAVSELRVLIILVLYCSHQRQVHQPSVTHPAGRVHSGAGSLHMSSSLCHLISPELFPRYAV